MKINRHAVMASGALMGALASAGMAGQVIDIRDPNPVRSPRRSRGRTVTAAQARDTEFEASAQSAAEIKRARKAARRLASR